MSQVATNSYIHKHQVDSRKGTTSHINNRQSEQLLLVQDARMVGSFAQAAKASGKKLLLEEITVTERVKLPKAKKGGKSASQSCYTELAAAFGKIFTAMGEGVQIETAIFGEQEKENTTNALCVLAGQRDSIKERKKIDTQRHKAERAEAKAKKFADAMQWVTIAITVICIVVFVAVPMVSAALAVPLEVAADTAEVATEAAAGAAEAGAEVGANAMTDLTAFSAPAETAGAETAGAGTAATTSAAITNTTEIIAPMISETTEEASWAVQALKFLGNRALNVLGAAIMDSPQLVSYIVNKKVVSTEREVASMQVTAGKYLARVSLMQAGFQTGQKETQQQSSVIQNLTSQLGDVISTYGDMMKSVKAATSSVAQAI